MHTPTCRTWHRDGQDCTCGANSSRDTMHAQALRCASNLNLAISEVRAHGSTLSEQGRERDRKEKNGKPQLSIGEIIWLQHKSTGDQRLAAFYGINTQNIGKEKMALAWLPSFECAKRSRANNILCRPTDAHTRGLDTSKVHIEGQELKRAYTRQTGDKREILSRLREQWNPDTPLTELSQIPGIDSYWVEPWTEWNVWRVTAPREEIKQRWRSQGRLKTKTIDHPFSL